MSDLTKEVRDEKDQQAELIAALAGTAVAGGVLTTKKFKKQAVRGPIVYVTTSSIVPAATTGACSGANPSGCSYVAVSATCPSGFRVIGGGIKFPDPSTPPNTNTFISDSYPTANGWAGHAGNFAFPNRISTLAVTTAICAQANLAAGSPPSS
jgi:hypothetical protein